MPVESIKSTLYFLYLKHTLNLALLTFLDTGRIITGKSTPSK